ncbi:MAG TPA: MFS transporter [Puia sp.]|nr:MFS transporter [Puia sp.]
MPLITRTIWILSIVSMFADVASEMLYPVVPVYLKEIGFSFFLIGLLEGLAEFTAGLSKGYFGNLSDNTGKRLPFIKWGYFLSGLSKPMMAMFTYPLWIFSARTLDRLGKGLRTGARDAILSQETTPATKATVFGFHRGWDTAGAVLGPALALIYLHFKPAHYRELFYFAFLPGMLAVACLFLLKERKNQPSNRKKPGFFSFFHYWKESNLAYRKLVSGLLAFAFFNSSDVFLLLMTKQITGNDTLTIGAYIFYNLVYACTSYPLGIVADKFGLKRIFVVSLFLFAIVYAGFAFARIPWMVFGLFFLYGLYAAGTEGISKAMITNLAGAQQTATAIGFYTSCQSIAALAASAWAGFLWSQSGATATFLFSAIGTFLVAFYLIIFFSPENKMQENILTK